jgi:TPR repeat protein
MTRRIKALIAVGLLLLACGLQSTAFSQTVEQILYQAAGQQSGRPSSAELSPAQQEILRQKEQEAAARREVDRQRQQAALAAQGVALENWNQSLAAKQRADENQEKALRYNMDLALKGDDYGEYRMGQRYRDGENVPRDLNKAREWLAKSAAQGNKAAATELARLAQNLADTASTNKPAKIKLTATTVNGSVATNR